MIDRHVDIFYYFLFFSDYLQCILRSQELVQTGYGHEKDPYIVLQLIYWFVNTNQ